MAIEKMSLINLVGNLCDLDSTLLACLNSGYFHPENAIHTTDSTHGFSTLDEANPYTDLVTKAEALAFHTGIKLGYANPAELPMDSEGIKTYLAATTAQIDAAMTRKETLKAAIDKNEQALRPIEHLAGLDVSFDDLFTCQYVKVRVGRLPLDSCEKLAYYDNKTFFFFSFSKDSEYEWGLYFAPATKIAVIDDIFTSLYFERIHIPDFAHGTPQDALGAIKQTLAGLRAELQDLRNDLADFRQSEEKTLLQVFSRLKFLHTAFAMRHYAAVLNERFYVVGFVPQSKESAFKAKMKEIKSVSCVAKPYNADPTLSPPVKLKNNRFARPFETFVKMYSLPSYKDVDPTSFVAISYSIIFGIMFGDLGQGLLLLLIGWAVSKFTKMKSASILIRLGLSSALFGTLYGSVFGYEEVLTPMYQKVFGLADKPIRIFDNNTTNMLLLGALGVGIALILISMLLNTIMSFKAKDYEKAVFGHNGIAGMVLYSTLVLAICEFMIPEIKVMNTLFIILGIVVPLFCIFFAVPLGKLVKHRKDFMPASFGEYVAENFFELFEYLLSYLSNTMSFLRVGGFILSHAGMMAVVMTLSEMTSGIGSPIVVIIGNLFVMALEGLIVGIQVLRLEFYEMFSRFYEGNGTPFAPVRVKYEASANVA